MKMVIYSLGRSLGALMAVLLPLYAWATPSTHVWSPSPDIQAHGTVHLTADMYVPVEEDSSGSKPDSVTDVGLEGGYWPVKDKMGIEGGFDLIHGYGPLDDYPLYFNAKVGTPENSLFEHSPALGVGGYNFGTESNKTTQNIFYFKAGETLSIGDLSLGRFSAGWFWGNGDVLVDSEGDSEANGVMLTWERTLSELSNKLWVCLDYQGSESGAGALAPGLSWKFADNTSVIFGYVIPNNSDLSQTFTVQVDIDMDLLK